MASAAHDVRTTVHAQMPAADVHASGPGLDWVEDGRTAPLPQGAVEGLPMCKVVLHNDDVNGMLYVVRTVIELTALPSERALEAMMEAHITGRSLLLVTHRERAELVVEQFRSKGLVASVERA